VETDSVPATRIAGNLFLASSEGKTEPIAGRIIEVQEDAEQTGLYRNPRSGFIAYVPTGSIRKGEDLVTTGGPALQGNSQAGRKTTPCSTCHGRISWGWPTYRRWRAAPRAASCDSFGTSSRARVTVRWRRS
jgi:hypothetical protein